MSAKANALRVKKKAETHAEACNIAAKWRFWVTTLSLLLAAGAVVCALLGFELMDRIFAVLVLIALVIEAAVFGYTHWREDIGKSNAFASLAENAGRVANGDLAVSEEQLLKAENELGRPNYAPFILKSASSRVEAQWRPGIGGVIFDSSRGIDEGCFEFFESKLYQVGVGEVGEQGGGNITYSQNVVIIARTNTVGRVRLKLTSYEYKGEHHNFLPADPHLPKRRLLIKFEAKVSNGAHSITVQFKLPDGPPHHGLAVETPIFEVTNPEWQLFKKRFRFLPRTTFSSSLTTR